MSIQPILQILLFLSIFVLEGRFRVREFGSDSVDAQILLKLGFWAIAMAICALFFRLWGRKIFRIDNFLFIPLMGIILASCFYAPSIAYSAGSAFTILALFSMMFACCSLLESRQVLKIILAAITLASVFSLFLYFALPEFGRMKIWSGDYQIASNRLSGLSNPNSTGILSALGVLIAVFYKNYTTNHSKKLNWVLTGCGAVNFIVLLLTNSRTALLALIIALTAAYFSKLTHTRLALLFAGLAVIIVLAATIDPTPILEKLSRSGDADEIMTGTSRVYIWGKVIEMINMRPLTGWGYGSSSFIIPHFAKEIGHTPPHAHNMFLQLAFSIGYGGLFLFSALCITKLYFSFKFGDVFKIALLFLILIHGLAEASVFQSTAGNATLVFALIMAMDYRPRRKKEAITSSQDLQILPGSV